MLKWHFDLITVKRLTGPQIMLKSIPALYGPEESLTVGSSLPEGIQVHAQIWIIYDFTLNMTGGKKL